MSNISIHIITNAFWAVVFGCILLGIARMFRHKHSKFKKIPSLFVMMLCSVQCIGKVLLSFLYGTCIDLVANPLEMYSWIYLVSSFVQSVTYLLIAAFLFSLWIPSKIGSVSFLHKPKQ